MFLLAQCTVVDLHWPWQEPKGATRKAGKLLDATHQWVKGHVAGVQPLSQPGLPACSLHGLTGFGLEPPPPASTLCYHAGWQHPVAAKAA